MIKRKKMKKLIILLIVAMAGLTSCNLPKHKSEDTKQLEWLNKQIELKNNQINNLNK